MIGPKILGWINASRALGVVRSLKPEPSAEPTFEPVAPAPEVLAAIELEAEACRHRLDEAQPPRNDIYIDMRLPDDVEPREIADELARRLGWPSRPTFAEDRSWVEVESLVLAELAVMVVGSSPWEAARAVFGGGSADVDASGKASRSVVEPLRR